MITVEEEIRKLTPDEIQAYMDRIGYTGSWEPTKETLDELVWHHQCNVPFETLDPHEFGIPVKLDQDVLFDKIVRRRRGGYCLELNGSIKRLLLSLGFSVRPCLARVMLGTGEYAHPIDHGPNLVTIEGKTYICDVGLGGPMAPGGLDIHEDEWQCLRGEYFRVTPDVPGWYAIHRKTGGSSDVYNETGVEERIELLFTTIQCYDTDFQFLNNYMSTHPEALHKNHRILNRRTAEGYCAIWDDEFKELRNGTVVTEQIGDRLYQILEEKFGIVL